MLRLPGLAGHSRHDSATGGTRAAAYRANRAMRHCTSGSPPALMSTIGATLNQTFADGGQRKITIVRH